MVQQPNAIEKYIEYLMPHSPETHQSFFFHFPQKAITLISSLCVFPEILVVNTSPCKRAKSLRFCLTLCKPLDCSPLPPFSAASPAASFDLCVLIHALNKSLYVRSGMCDSLQPCGL